MRFVLTGASGQLGAYLVEHLADSGHEVIAWSHSTRGTVGQVPLQPVDLADGLRVERALAAADPEVILHAAALSSAEAARQAPERARAVNVDATARLAQWCQRHERRIVYTSTDLVFDGLGSWYREVDQAEPVLVYGRTKRDGEPSVLATDRGLVARLSLLYGPSQCGRPSFFERIREAIKQGQPQELFVDEFRTPLDLNTASKILVRLAESEYTGLVHLAGRERMSRFEMMQRAAAAMNLDASLLRTNRRADTIMNEPRPADVSLDTSRLAALLPQVERPSIESALGNLGPDAVRCERR